MMDFKESLKDIKKQMQALNRPQNAQQRKKSGAQGDDLGTIFLKEERLRDEFAALIQGCDIKKI